ncbi:hypothetical protein Tco_0435504 [Tanacetum coccineum]
MAALKFASSHNMVAFLDKPTKSDGFEQIIDFLNAHPIKYVLMVNPTIYTACIEQFWATAKVKTINGEVHIQALVDKKKVVITETSIRSDLQLEDAKALFSPQWKFLIHTILQCLSAKTTAWNEFSSTMASAIICLATNQKFNFSKYIFDNMVKNLEGGVKFLMYPRFVQVFLDQQVEGMSKYKEIYVTPSHSKKVFANMKRQGKDFSSRDTPLFLTMIVQVQEQSRRKQRKETEVSQLSGPTEPVTDDTENVAIKKLEGKRKSKPPGMKILFKIGKSTQVVSSEDEGLGDQEDASKQGRKIANIDADVEVTLVDETQGRNDEEMFDTCILNDEELFAKQDVVEKEVSTTEVATDSTTTITIDELTLAQTSIEIKVAKPKTVTTAATTTTTDVTRPKARGVVVQDPNYELAARLQEEEQGELTIEEKSRLFMELMNKRKKHLTRLRAKEKRRKPPTKAQKRNTMSIYLKNMARYKHNQLKTKSFEDIQMLFDKEMKRVNTFVDMDIELVKGSETRIEGSSKRAREELKSENLKKQKLNENVEAEVDDEKEMKKHIEIVPDDEVAIDAIPLATKPPIIVHWKIIKEGKMGYFQIIRADGSSKRYTSMIKMLLNINREDLETLWKLVKAKHGLTRPEEAYERVLWGDLKVMFEPDVEIEVWRNL